MLQRFWSFFRSGDRSKSTDLNENYVQWNDLGTISSRRYQNSIEDPNEIQVCLIQPEREFECREIHKDSYSSNHWKMVKILKKYKNKNLDDFTREEAEAVMKKIYPILEKIFIKDSPKKFYTSWLAFFYALTAEHSQFNALFKDLIDKSWWKSDRSKERKNAYKFVCFVARDSFLTRSLLQTKPPCYEELTKEVPLIFQEKRSRARVIVNN